MEQTEPFNLESASMPPELYDIDEDRWQTGEGQISDIQLFADDVSGDNSPYLGTKS